MSRSGLIESFEECSLTRLMDFGNRRWDSRSIDVARDIGKELDLNVGDVGPDLPSLIHTAVAYDMRHMEEVVAPLFKTYEVFKRLDRNSGKSINTSMDRDDYMRIRDGLLVRVERCARALRGSPLNYVQAILIVHCMEGSD